MTAMLLFSRSSGSFLGDGGLMSHFNARGDVFDLLSIGVLADQEARTSHRLSRGHEPCFVSMDLRRSAGDLGRFDRKV
jgi:hypothetical protein